MRPSSPPITVPLVDLKVSHEPFEGELRDAFRRVLESGHFTAGLEAERFEDALARRVNTRHAVGVGSGTAALHLMLVAAGIGPGDEVLLPPNTFFATAEAVVHSGATPVFVDVDRDTALIDLELADAAVTNRTAAVIGVHLYGQPVAADEAQAFASRHGLLFLEDAAQAIGATWAGEPVGSLGHAAGFSFYPTKNVGALGEAGAVTTNDAQLAARVRSLANHGEAMRHQHVEFGFNERIDELQSAFLAVMLAHLDELQCRRDGAVRRYADVLSQIPGVRRLVCNPAAGHVHHLMVVSVRRRDAVLAALRSEGIGAAVHYPTPIHLQPAYAQFGAGGTFPKAERLAESVLSLPLFPGITENQIMRVVQALARTVEQAA